MPIDGSACCYRTCYPNASFALGKRHHSIPEGTVDPTGGIFLHRRSYVAVNIGTPWSFWNDQDIRWGLDHNRAIEEIATSCRGNQTRLALTSLSRLIPEFERSGDGSAGDIRSDARTGSGV